MALVDSWPTPFEEFRLAIETWEGTWEDSPYDSGNYAHGWDGSVRLVGTMRGVTPDAYAAYLKVDPATITAEQMQSEVTLDVAADIAVADYYRAPGFALLTWSPLVDVSVDIGWGSGPVLAIRMLQSLVCTHVDGILGPQTRHAVNAYVEAHGPAAACVGLAQRRIEFYMSISEPGTQNARFRQGWLNRADWFLPSNPVWWDRWKGWTMTVPVASKKPAGLHLTRAA
ncbi:MAG: hypothetical protein JOY71_14515 [Acetobacteraceae bacterium]|nr:hypothetical protein [Acetobacteraceae bacterium]